MTQSAYRQWSGGYQAGGAYAYLRSDSDRAFRRVFTPPGDSDKGLGYRAKRCRHMSTSGCRKLLADFTTGPQTRLIAIKVMRVPGNPLIKGTFWLDDVKLTPVAPVEADH